MDSNSSSRVVQSEVHENDEHHHPYVNLDKQQVEHSEEQQHHGYEKKSVLNKVKAKARKIKDTIKKHGYNVLDHGHGNEDHHIPSDQDLDEEEKTGQDQEVHEAPIHESEAVRSVTPTSEQVENLGKSGVNYGDSTVKGEEEPYPKAQVTGISPTTEINQDITTDQAKTFAWEEKSEQQPKLEEDPHVSGSKPEAYTAPKYNQTEVTDLTRAGDEEIDITPVEKSFERMNVQDELNLSPEPKVLPNVTEAQSPGTGSHNQFVNDLCTATKTEDPSAEIHDQYIPELSGATKTQTQYPSAGSHDQFVPDFFTAAKSQNPSDGSHDQFAPETISTSTNRDCEIPEATEQTFNTTTTKVEEQPRYENNEYGVEKGDTEDKVTFHEEEKKIGDASNQSASKATEYGKNIAQSMAEKLAPVYGRVADVGSAVKSKVSGTGAKTENEVKEEKKGVSSVKDYLAEKLRPGDNEDHHIPNYQELDEKEKMDQDQEVHETPIHESEAIRSVTPTTEQIENLEKSGVNSGGTTVKGEEEHHGEPRVTALSPATEINQDITTDQAKTFAWEENSKQQQKLEEDPHVSGGKSEAYTAPNYNQTEVTDLTGAVCEGLTGTTENDITPVEKSFERMNVQDELNPSPEPRVLPNVIATKTEDPSAEIHDQYIPELSCATKTQTRYPSAGSHDQFVPDFSSAAKIQYPSDGNHDQIAQETISTSTNRDHEISDATEETFNNTTTEVEEQASYETNEYGEEKGDREDKVTIHEEEKKIGDASNKSGSKAAEYGKNIAHSLTGKLAPVYGKVAEVGSAVKSKVSATGAKTDVGTETENVVKEENKGVSSVKDYLAEKLRPGEEDKALSEIISETLYKRKDQKKDEESEKVSEESSVNGSPRKGVVNKLKGVVGSWFGKPGENQTTQGDEGLPKSENSGGVEQVSKAEGEIRVHE